MSADQNIHRAMAMQSTTAKLTKKQAETFEFKVLDDRKVWNTETPIELFHTSCRNKSDEITVQSRNTQKAVAPGTEGDYTFSLQNSGKRNVQYKVWFDADSISAIMRFRWNFVYPEAMAGWTEEENG